MLERAIEDLLTRPRGRPSYAPLVRYRSFEYQAASWDRPRRVIAKVEHHFGELFPRVGFIVTTLTGTNRAVVRFYNQRGTAEQWIKEGKTATHWTRLSCHRFRANEVRLLLGVIAYNLGNLLRRLVLLVPDEPAAAAVQDRRAADPACAVLHPAAGRKPVDSALICADHPAHRAARAAPDVIKRPTLAERMSCRRATSAGCHCGGRIHAAEPLAHRCQPRRRGECSPCDVSEGAESG